MIRERRRTEERDLESDDAIRWISINGEKNAATINLVKGHNIYGEKLVKYEDEEYRIWDPFRSKLAAALKKGMKNMPIKNGSKVLYLGASTGTTVSHVSDIDRKSTRLNSSHANISYAVFCLKKKKMSAPTITTIASKTAH